MNDFIRRFLICFGLGLCIAGVIIFFRNLKPIDQPVVDGPNIHHVSITVTNLDTNVIRFNINLQY
jgi:hypothetical protein